MKTVVTAASGGKLRGDPPGLAVPAGASLARLDLVQLPAAELPAVAAGHNDAAAPGAAPSALAPARPLSRLVVSSDFRYFVHHELP